MTLIPRQPNSVYDPNAANQVDVRTPEVAAPPIDAGELVAAAFRQENVIGSILSQRTSTALDDPSYNPWGDIAGTEYEEYWDRFVDVRSAGQAAARKQQIDMELADRRTLAAAGGWGLLASIGAGVFSPENLLPGGTIYRGVKGGQAALRTGISTATMAAVSTGAAELALSGSQQLRTPGESALNIGGSALIGGALGAGLSALFTKSDYARLGKQFDTEMQEVMQTGGFTLEVAAKVNDEMTKRLVTVGRTADDASKEASLYGAFYQTMSKRTGKSVDELLAASPLPEVRGGMTGPDPDGVVYNQDGRIAIETPEFQRWFGESAVRAPDGKPLVVYHGGVEGIEAFESSSWRYREFMVGEARDKVVNANFFTADREVANSYRAKVERQNIRDGDKAGAMYEVFVKIENPLRVDWNGKKFTTGDPSKLIDEAQAGGHDGIVVTNVVDDYNQKGKPTTLYVPFSSQQIKSVNNRGTFDPNDPRILFQVSPDQAREIDMAVELPTTPEFTQAVAATEGAQITPDGLLIDLVRFQKPEQEGSTSVRTGVFYLPLGSPNARHYKSGGQPEQWYGGAVKVTGNTLLKRPLFVKGATGGKAPEAAYDAIRGKGAAKKLGDEAQSAALAPRNIREEVVERFLSENGADASMAYEIIENSKQGNQLRYALQENVIAHAVREAGYDAVIGYSKGKVGPFISEVFDVREIDYPVPGEAATLHPMFERSSRRYGQRDPNAFPGDGPRGSIEVGNGSPVIRLFESADRSTFLHETGHFFLESYRMMAGSTPELKADWDALSAYLDIGPDGRVSVAAHEKFARSFEAYLLDGSAPSEALKGAFEQFRDWLVAIYKQIASLNVPINDDVRGIFDRMLATDAEIARARDPLFANERLVMDSIRKAADADAAARPLETIDENTIAGRGAQIAGGAVRGLNLVLRVLHSASPAVRSIGTRLFENPIYLKKNMQGVASDPSVETLVKEYTQGAMARAMDAANGAYNDYRKAGGQLDRSQFNDAVGRAMRRGDEGADPAVSKAAQVWRSSVFDPLKDMAIKAGLLPPDVSVDTAMSYFTRVYNRPMIEAREGEFKGIVRRYIDKSIRDLEFKADEIRIGNKIVDADKANEKWRQAYDRLTSIDDRLAGRSAVRRKKVEDLNALQQLRFIAQKDRPPAELVKRLRNADENASALETLRDLRSAERSAGKKLKYAEKFPILSRIKQRGGVKVGSFLDFELRNMGVNPQSHPGLFKSQGGMGAVDNWPWDEDTLFMDNFGRMPDGYLDQDEVLAAIRQEVGGNPLRTPEQIAEDEALDALESNASAWLQEVGLPSNVSVGEARAFIRRMVGAEKAVDDLGLRISKMERDLEQFDEGTESLANERTISEAETAKLQEELNALEEEILEVRQLANASPRVGIIIDYAKVKRDLFKAKLDASRLERRVNSLKSARDDGRINDALAAELAAKTTDLNRALDRVDSLTKRADKLQPMVPKVRQELPDFVSDADRSEYVNQIVDDIFNTLTGRNADADIPRDIVAATRGPLKERTFHIPDSEIEDFLESNVEAVARRYARTMAADIELTNAFGKADLKAQIDEIKADYQRLRAAVSQGVDAETGVPLDKPLTAAQRDKEIKRLTDAEKADIRDLQALRDMVRGAYLARENSTNYARVARVAGTINYLRTMGGVTISSLTDVARHVMVHGLSGVMRDGLVPLISNLKGFKMSVDEAKIAGAVTDRLLNTRMATWADVTDPYSVSSPFERFMENTATGFSKLNGMVYWNDFQKSFASVITQNRILRGAADYGALDARERSYLAFLGIDGAMAERIAKQFDVHGSTETGGVRVAHTDDWDDDWARRVYRAAINKDVDSTIITKGVGDIPLFMNTPTGRLLGQFKSFALASHQRALMRGLQERPMGFVSGTLLAATVGAMIYWLKSAESNRLEDVSDNPGRWIAEGLDRSGVFSIAFEANNTIEKAFGIGAYGALAAAFPWAEQSGKASRYSMRSTAAALTGPTGDLIDTAIRAGQAIKGSADGWTEGDINSVKRLVPGATLPGIRSLVEYLGVPAVKDGLAMN